MRLIDADAFLAGEIKRCHCVPLVGSCEKDYEPLTCILDQEPSIDAVPVVRCKECKYGDYDSKPNGAMVCLRTNDGFWRKETDFCSYGERREG